MMIDYRKWWFGLKVIVLGRSMNSECGKLDGIRVE